METLTIQAVENALNACLKMQPPVDHVLGPDLRQLATVWGRMIAHRLPNVVLADLVPVEREALIRWNGAALPPCARPVFPDADCDVCQ